LITGSALTTFVTFRSVQTPEYARTSKLAAIS